MRLASFADDSQAQVLEDCSRGSGRDLFNFREAFRKRTPVKQILHIRNEEPTNRRFEFQKRGQLLNGKMGSVLTIDTRSSRFGDSNESLFQLECDGRQWRQVNEDRMFAAHPGHVLG